MIVKELDNGIKEIKKKYGNGIIDIGKSVGNERLQRFSTGSIKFDKTIGGGWPRGRSIELYGLEGSGKTALAIQTMASLQRNGEVSAFIDMEKTFDNEFAKKMGLNVDNFYKVVPETAEDALDIVEILCRAGGLGCIIIDSVAALIPKAEIEGGMGDTHMGLHARLMSQALRKLTGIASKSNITLIWINQIRYKIGVFGDAETTTGGKALDFYTSLRVRVGAATKGVTKANSIKNDAGETIGIKLDLDIRKNKTYKLTKKCSVDLLFSGGFDYSSELVDLLIEYNIIVKRGNSYTLPDTKDLESILNTDNKLSNLDMILEIDKRERVVEVGILKLRKRVKLNSKIEELGKQILNLT